MTRTLIGLDYLGVPAVKISKGDIDPYSTPDAQVSAWLYNSTWSKDVQVFSLHNPDFAAASFFEGGGDIHTASHITVKMQFVNANLHYYRAAYFAGLPYAMPFMDYKEVNYANNRFQTNLIKTYLRGYENRGGLWTTRNIKWSANRIIAINFTPTVGGVTTIDYGTEFQSNFHVPSGFSMGLRASFILWNLPGDETAIIDGAPQAPVPGQISIEINSAACRVAKPGYDVRFATPSQLAFDSTKRPPKIVVANDIYLPPGVTYFDSGLALPAGCVIDAAFYSGALVHYPCDPQDMDFGAEHWIEGQYVVFNNTGPACRGRFMVIAPHDVAPTFGTNNVLRQFDFAGQNVVQFLRPGSSTDPSFGDIILDSRWPSIQMMAEGFIYVGAGELQHTIPINGAGMFPVVKFMTVHGPGGVTNDSWSKQIRTPKVARTALYRVGWQEHRITGDSCYATVTDSAVVFHTFVGNPTEQYYSNGAGYDNNTPIRLYDPSPMYGIRYYIFGIPAP